MTLHLLARPHHPAAPASATIWKMLFDRQQALLHRWARPEFALALRELGLRREALPALPTLAQLVQQRTGWTLLFTGAPVDEASTYAALARRELPVVSRLRTFSEFDQPPGGPDLFADVLGRLPLLLEPGYAAALQQLGRAGALATTPAAAGLLRRFAHATFELGLLAGPVAGGRPQPYGATLLTSPRHLHALAAAEPAQLRPLAGAARHLALLGTPGAALAAEAQPYFVAATWAELAAELQQLHRELAAAQRPALGPHAAPAAPVAGSRAWAFASRVSSLRQAG